MASFETDCFQITLKDVITQYPNEPIEVKQTIARILNEAEVEHRINDRLKLKTSAGQSNDQKKESIKGAIGYIFGADQVTENCSQSNAKIISSTDIASWVNINHPSFNECYAANCINETLMNKTHADKIRIPDEFKNTKQKIQTLVRDPSIFNFLLESLTREQLTRTALFDY